MKKSIPILLICFLLVYVSSCEKDDICVEGDTPLMVIGFYDINDTTLAKKVPALRIRELVLDTVVNTFADRTALDSIGLPLRSEATTTRFVLIHNSRNNEAGEEIGDRDTITVSYGVVEAFVSRACGFVANYDGLAVALSAEPQPWIQDMKIVQQKIENSHGVHVKIFF